MSNNANEPIITDYTDEFASINYRAAELVDKSRRLVVELEWLRSQLFGHAKNCFEQDESPGSCAMSRISNADSDIQTALNLLRDINHTVGEA